MNRLRKMLEGTIVSMYHHHTEKKFPEICEKLSLPTPKEGLTKQKIMRATFEAAKDEDLPNIAKRFLEYYPPSAAIRNEIEDLLWASSPIPEISKKMRREIAEGLSIEDLYGDADEFLKLLDSIWILDDDLSAFTCEESRLLKEIRQHVLRNSDWSVKDLFKEVGALDSPTQRFARFLEGLTSPEVQSNVVRQESLVEILNVSLRIIGIELREAEERDGYPTYRVCSSRPVPADSPKNLIFASREKPDIRILDTIGNKLEIVSKAEKVLVYDRAISFDGISWQELQSWWKDFKQISDDNVAKTTLYKRLTDSLPENSPPQQKFFRAYHTIFGAEIPRLPALLPEVWFHWDPKTAKERGTMALTRFRMDFLMLLPKGVRVVLEIDGKHHYADNGDKADVNKYAKMAAADRELRFAGYEVFRFGAAELLRPDADTTIESFFTQLFKTHGVECDRRNTSTSK